MNSANSTNSAAVLATALRRIDTEALLAERSLSDFIRQAWGVIEPGTEYKHNWHIDAIAEHLEAVTAGQITRLLVNIPPRYMKSISVSVCWPVWTWIRRPETRWLFSSFSASLSTKHSVDRRTIIQSDWFQNRWSDRFRLTSDQNVKTEYVNSRRGSMVATSFGGTATGKGGDVIVVDDPHKPEEVLSDTVRDSHIRFFDQTLSTRLDNKKTGAIVVVMQRLHEKDLSGHVLEGGGYTHLCLPAEAEARTVVHLPISGREIVREVGDVLWPEREGPVELARAKRQLGTWAHAAQYQQRASPRGGDLFKSEWLRRWRLSEDGEFYLLERPDGTYRPVRVSDCTRFATIDVAGTEKQAENDPDYFVGQVYDLTPTYDLIMVHQWRGRWEVPEASEIAVRKCRTYDVPFAIVEKNGLGLAIVQTMRRNGIAVRGVSVQRDKVTRSQTAQIRMEAGTMFFPMHAAWWGEFEAELLRFPKAAHDDQVDPLSLAAIHVQRVGGPPADEQEDKTAVVMAAQREEAQTATAVEDERQEKERRERESKRQEWDVDDERIWDSMG